MKGDEENTKCKNAFLYYNPFEFIHLGYDEIACLFLLQHLSRIAEAGKCRWCKRSLSDETWEARSNVCQTVVPSFIGKSIVTLQLQKSIKCSL
jgi:hypothetical protein